MSFYFFSQTADKTVCVGSKEAFLFSLVNPYEVKPVKMPVMKEQRESAIACRHSIGPSFGADNFWVDYDLQIANNANKSRSSYSGLGGCYSCPEGKEDLGDIFLAGTKNFIVTDYEVFEFY